jgi:hypothetical protein
VPVPSSIALGCAGMGMGVIRSFCARAGEANSISAAQVAAVVVVLRVLVMPSPVRALCSAVPCCNLSSGVSQRQPWLEYSVPRLRLRYP